MQLLDSCPLCKCLQCFPVSQEDLYRDENNNNNFEV